MKYQKYDDIDSAKPLKKLKDSMEIRCVLTECIGSFGPWQFWMTFAIFMSRFSVGWHMLSIVMIGPEVKFNCSNAKYAACDDECPSREFDRSVFKETISTQWDLVCGRLFMRDLAQTVTMAGILCGNLFWGFVSDRFGRLYPFIIEILLQGVTGILAMSSPWFWFFNVMRFLAAFATGGFMITGFVLLMEIIGIKYRSLVGILFHIPFYLGHLTLPLIGYVCREWKLIQIVISVPSLLFFVYYWVLPESPRWLAMQGKEDRAIEVLKKAARFNGLPTEGIDEKVPVLVHHAIGSPPEKGSALDLVRTPIMRKYTIAIAYNWIVCSTCYYGVTQYIGKIGSNVFVSVMISAVTQIPSTFFACWSTKYLGRRISLMLADSLGALGMALILVTPTEPEFYNYINTIVAMAGFSLGFPTIYLFSGELFPTNIRNIGCGICSMLGRVGAMIAPHISSLSEIRWWLPPAIFSFIPLLGAILTYILPETLDCPLPDTVEDVEFQEREKKAKTRRVSLALSSSHHQLPHHTMSINIH